MIIFGTSSTKITSENIVDKCPNCNSQNTVTISVFQKYAHVFWIPFFPYKKVGESICTNCKQVVAHKKFDGGINLAYQNIKQNARTPIWTFLGMLLLAAFIAWIINIENERDIRKVEFINKPKVEDIYEIKTSEDNYTIYKVVAIESNKVFVLKSQLESTKSTGLTDLELEANQIFKKDTAIYTIAQLKEMVKEGEIFDIERK